MQNGAICKNFHPDARMTVVRSDVPKEVGILSYTTYYENTGNFESDSL